MSERSTAKSCPYCGVTTDVPHETQEGCIDALHGEIARMREILQYVRVPEKDGVSDDYAPEARH